MRAPHHKQSFNISADKDWMQSAGGKNLSAMIQGSPAKHLVYTASPQAQL